MEIPHLGVGMGFRSNYRAELFLNPKIVDFLEITADHYFTQNSQKFTLIFSIGNVPKI